MTTSSKGTKDRSREKKLPGRGQGKGACPAGGKIRRIKVEGRDFSKKKKAISAGFNSCVGGSAMGEVVAKGKGTRMRCQGPRVCTGVTKGRIFIDGIRGKKKRQAKMAIQGHRGGQGLEGGPWQQGGKALRVPCLAGPLERQRGN